MNEMNSEMMEKGPVIYPEPPREHIYNGNQGFATASLVLGILALVSMCCFPPAAFVFGGLGLLFGVMSKGSYARPGNAKAGMTLSAVGLAIAAGIVIFACAMMLSDSKGRSFFSEYFNILMHPEQYTEDEIYDFLDKYLYPEDGDSDFYEDGMYPYDHYDGYDDYYDDHGDDFDRHYQSPDYGNDDVI